MNESNLLAITFSLVAVMFGLLSAILGWIGNRTYQKMDEMAKTLDRIAGDLHEKINGLDKRITIVEIQHRACEKR